jgi:two-component system, LytTR family, response regulator
MKKINCLVVDDEELARTLLENYISRIPHLNLVEKCANPLEALKVLEENQIDLLFLDIQMPELSGIDFLKSLQQKPKVIFTTAYSEYAIEGYQLDVVDYLLKPFSFERFVQAVNKAVELLKTKTDESEKDYILVKSEHKVHKIKFEDIRYIQSMREYVAYFLPMGKILALNSLKKLEIDLPSDQFIRIHKSYIIPIQKVTTLEGNMIHIGNEKLPIGNLYKNEVLKRIF